MSKIKRTFVAGNHYCWFSSNYKDKTVNQVMKINPAYLLWCLENLHHLKFQDSVRKRIRKVNQTPSQRI